MNRRRFLLAATASTISLTGCLGQQDDTGTAETTPRPTDNTGSTPTATESSEPSPADEQSPTPTPTPETESEPTPTPVSTAETKTDTAGYDTLEVRGQTVPLAPTSDAYSWYQDTDLGVVDARSKVQWERARIEGAVLSPAPDGQETNDPVSDWEKDRRILTYCGCPHHLSSLRAATLLKNGYTNVYALDKGIRDWLERGLPSEGTAVKASLPSYTIQGKADPATAGSEAWVRHPPTGQREVTTIRDDGSYEMTLHFYELSPETPIVVDTPTYRLRAPLGRLTETVVTGQL